MNKVMSIILVLVLCLSLCACEDNSKNNKYVGVYETDYNTSNNAVFYTVSIELRPDGTGTYTGIATKVDASQCVITLKEGSTVQEGTVTWEVSDDYIIIHYSVTTNLTKKQFGKWSTTTNEPKSYTNTYELKGSKLINVEHDWETWNKTK